MSTEHEDKPPGKLLVRVRTQEGGQLSFQLKPTATLRKLMGAFCERFQMDRGSVVFSFEGQRLREDDTPNAVGLEDGDVIDVMVHQVGGTHRVC